MFQAKGDAAISSDSAGKPQSAWDKLLTTTPVVMTVVATLLAGLSSSEMTKAQYHRSLAAQSQSKVGDQWAFFQAKRARGASHDLTVKLLRAITDSQEIDPDALQASAERVAAQLQLGQKQARDLSTQLAKAPLGANGDPVRKAAERLAALAQDNAAKAQALRSRMAETLADADVKKALSCLSADALADADKQPRSRTAEDPGIQQALDEIAQRKTEQETEAAIAPIQESALQQAILATENDAKAFDEAGKPINKGLSRVDKLIEEEVGLARSFARAASAARDALDQLTAEGSKLPEEVRQTAATLHRNAAALKAALNELNNNFTAAQLRYHGWRYQHEARDNQRTAGLYEIQVRKNSWTAERHRRRSA